MFIDCLFKGMPSYEDFAAAGPTLRSFAGGSHKSATGQPQPRRPADLEPQPI
jgi:hypothetical protein